MAFQCPGGRFMGTRIDVSIAVGSTGGMGVSCTSAGEPSSSSEGFVLTFTVDVLTEFGGRSEGFVTSLPVSIVDAIAARDETRPVPATNAAMRRLGSLRDPTNRNAIKMTAAIREMSAIPFAPGVFIAPSSSRMHRRARPRGRWFARWGRRWCGVVRPLRGCSHILLLVGGAG